MNVDNQIQDEMSLESKILRRTHRDVYRVGKNSYLAVEREGHMSTTRWEKAGKSRDHISVYKLLWHVTSISAADQIYDCLKLHKLHSRKGRTNWMFLCTPKQTSRSRATFLGGLGIGVHVMRSIIIPAAYTTRTCRASHQRSCLLFTHR